MQTLDAQWQMTLDYSQLNLAITSIVYVVQTAVHFLEETETASGPQYVAFNMMTAFILFPIKAWALNFLAWKLV